MRPTPEHIAKAFRDACLAELQALKPGNVHVFADGHRMTVDDFRLSAEAASGPISRPGAGVGARIAEAVAATRAAVGTNTNLGIILLAAPIAAAAERDGPLRTSIEAVLAGLDRDDAALAFAAIRLAAPAGLGRSPRHDVNEPPTGTLAEAMAEAAGRDRIARAYADGFGDVFGIGLPALEQARRRPILPWWPATAVYLAFLSTAPDTHIARKHGETMAEAVRNEAAELCAALSAGAGAEALARKLGRFDRGLKERGLNPGTSADFTVATLFAAAISSILRQGLDNG